MDAVQLMSSFASLRENDAQDHLKEQESPWAAGAHWILWHAFLDKAKAQHFHSEPFPGAPAAREFVGTGGNFPVPTTYYSRRRGPLGRASFHYLPTRKRRRLFGRRGVLLVAFISFRIFGCVSFVLHLLCTFEAVSGSPRAAGGELLERESIFRFQPTSC